MARLLQSRRFEYIDKMRLVGGHNNMYLRAVLTQEGVPLPSDLA